MMFVDEALSNKGLEVYLRKGAWSGSVEERIYADATRSGYKECVTPFVSS